VNESELKNGGAVIALAGAILVIAIASVARPLLAYAINNAGRPVTVSLAGALLSVALTAGALRLVITRRVLSGRVALLVVPADSFDPGEDSVLAFASALARTRRSIRGFFDERASAVRVRIDADDAGRLRYEVEVPEHAVAALKVGLSAYGSTVQLLEAPARPAPAVPGRDRNAHTSRVELVLARGSSVPLRRAGLDPDPLSGFARALAALDSNAGEEGCVCIDLLPIQAGRRRRIRRRLLREARLRSGRAVQAEDRLGPLLAPDARSRRGGSDPAELVSRRLGRHALDRKIGGDEPLFELQVLASVESPIGRGRAKSHLGSILAAFDTFSGENHLRASGIPIPGVAFLGSDLPGRRRRFDRRIDTGLFRPARRKFVTAGEVAGFLKPPSVHCAGENVLRSGAAVGPPPRGLRTFAGESDLIPIGKVAEEDGERTVGVSLADTFFSYRAGRSRFGKTEPALCEFVHMARSGHGCLLLDPHHDGIERAKPYLTEEGVRDRVIEIDLTDSRRQPAWNLLAASGRSPARTAGQVDAVVDAFASALRWDEVNSRALNLTSQSVQALVDLARTLPPELAPTIFEIPTLLSDDAWRAAVLPHVSAPVRRFFEERFPRLSPEAITPITNLCDRLRLSAAAAALLGNPLRSYDVREAMDEGAIVLMCPGWGSTRDRLIANFGLFDAFHALLSRGEIADTTLRRLFWMWFDEVQIYDGASNGTFAAIPEQIGKFGGRATYINQNPERLSAATRQSIFTNRSHIYTTALDRKGSTVMAGELGHGIDDEGVAGLARFNSLGSVTVAGRISAPFRLQGLSLDELYPGESRLEDVAILDEAIARNSGYVPVAETVANIDGHAREIAVHLAGGGRDHPQQRRSGIQKIGGAGA
jgi:hypothetical protein